MLWKKKKGKQEGENSFKGEDTSINVEEKESIPLQSNWIGIFTLPYPPPDMKIKKSFGLIYVERVTKMGTMFGGDKEGVLVDKIVKQLIEKAKNKGANAILGFQLSIGSFEQKGSQWMEMYFVAYGEAIILERK